MSDFMLGAIFGVCLACIVEGMIWLFLRWLAERRREPELTWEDLLARGWEACDTVHVYELKGGKFKAVEEEE